MPHEYAWQVMVMLSFKCLVSPCVTHIHHCLWTMDCLWSTVPTFSVSSPVPFRYFPFFSWTEDMKETIRHVVLVPSCSAPSSDWQIHPDDQICQRDGRWRVFWHPVPDMCVTATVPSFFYLCTKTFQAKLSKILNQKYCLKRLEPTCTSWLLETIKSPLGLASGIGWSCTFSSDWVFIGAPWHRVSIATCVGDSWPNIPGCRRSTVGCCVVDYWRVAACQSLI